MSEESEIKTEPDPKDPHTIRLFIFEAMANSEIDGKILVENMNYVFEWVQNGVVPATITRMGKVK